MFAIWPDKGHNLSHKIGTIGHISHAIYCQQNVHNLAATWTFTGIVLQALKNEWPLGMVTIDSLARSAAQRSICG